MMKKYESPEIVIMNVENVDVITTSRGDTPWLGADFEW